MVTLPGLPTLDWIGDDAPTSQVGDALTMSAGPQTDWFNDPAGPTRLSSAPALVFAVDSDVQLSATVTVDFAAMFDAGVLFVHQTDDDWAKLCFEQAPSGDAMAVSVVTRLVSDDCNGPVVTGNTVRLRVSKIGGAIAFHHALVDDPTETWHMTRLFALRYPDLPMHMGVLAQSPTGDGCQVTFSDLRVVRETLRDQRNGS
jgi:regulation of enolase protein 1 (concanavalin A-like superfamily)